MKGDSLSAMSQHFYTVDGKPCHTQIIKSGPNKGQERPTTVRDARKLELYPSVSGYTNVLHMDLNDWNMKGVLDVVLDNPGLVAMTDKDEVEFRNDFKREIIAQWSEIKAEAPERGTAIHARLDAYFRARLADRPLPDIAPYENVIAMVDSLPSKPVASERIVKLPRIGYAGTADLILENGAIVDFKSKNFKGADTVKPSDSHPLAMAAYFAAANNRSTRFVECYNIYFCREEPGRLMLRTWTPDELMAAWKVFVSCTRVYRWVKKYDARRGI